MHGPRLGLLAAAAVAALLATAAPAGAMTAPTARSGPARHGHHRVCATPAPHAAACHAHVVTDADTGRPLATATWGGNGYSPQQLQAAYRPAGTAAPLVAVVDAYANPNAASDLAAYRKQFRLGQAKLTQVSQDGGSIRRVAGDVGWGMEEMLDLEMVSALCPDCPILYVGARSASYGNLATAVLTAKALGAKVISNSYGSDEFSAETGLTQWNMPGVVVTVSSGDSGYGAQFPASAAGVVAVGGTSLTLNTDLSRMTETVWAGAGSGCSAYISKPVWQTDTGAGGCSRRTVADVAAVADPATGVAVYDSYGSANGASWYVFGGTSVAAPLVGAVFARGGGVPAGTPAAKALWGSPSTLFDVTSGSNGTCSPAYWCTGGVGYDGPTGNGTPDGNATAF